MTIFLIFAFDRFKLVHSRAFRRFLPTNLHDVPWNLQVILMQHLFFKHS